MLFVCVVFFLRHQRNFTSLIFLWTFETVTVHLLNEFPYSATLQSLLFLSSPPSLPRFVIEKCLVAVSDPFPLIFVFHWTICTSNTLHISYSLRKWLWSQSIKVIIIKHRSSCSFGHLIAAMPGHCLETSTPVDLNQFLLLLWLTLILVSFGTTPMTSWCLSQTQIIIIRHY